MSKAQARLIQPGLCCDFPAKPTCLAYDKTQELLAIGCDDGWLLFLMKDPKIDKFTYRHAIDEKRAVELLSFALGKKYLLTKLKDIDTLYLWKTSSEDIDCTGPFNITMSQPSDCGTDLLTPTVLKWSPSSSIYYVGTKDGSVYVVDIPENGENCKQVKPEKLLAESYGKVIAIEEPTQPKKAYILVVFSSGMCIVFHKQSKSMGKQRIDEVPVSAWWKDDGKSFNVVCSSGNLVVTSFKYEYSGGKNQWHFEKPSIVTVGTAGITKFQLNAVPDRGELYMAYTGGCPLPTTMCDDSHVISLCHAADEPVTRPLVPFSSKVVDFVFLLCTPAQKGGQKKLLLAVLTESEVELLNCNIGRKCVCDGKTMYRFLRAYPFTRCPRFTSPVTCLQHCGVCSEKLLAAILSTHAQENLKKEMNGQPYLVITGHADGSVRLWICYQNKEKSSHTRCHLAMVIYTKDYFNETFSKTGDQEPSAVLQVIESERTGKDAKPLYGVSFVKAVDSQYLLVVNEAHRVLVFNLHGGNGEISPQTQEVILTEKKGKSSPLTTPAPYLCPCKWHTNVQLLQHFSCWYLAQADGVPSAVAVNCVEYNAELDMLAVGTHKGLIVLDTKENMLVEVICSEKKLLDGLIKPMNYSSLIEENVIALPEKSLDGKDDMKNCSKDNCNIVCLELAEITWDYQGTSQLTLWVGTKGGSLGVFSITRGRVSVEMCKVFGSHVQQSIMNGIHISQQNWSRSYSLLPFDGIGNFNDGEIVITPVDVVVARDKTIKVYQFPAGEDLPKLKKGKKLVGETTILKSGGIIESEGQNYFIYLAKGGYLVLNDIPVDDRFTFMRKLQEPKYTKVEKVFLSSGGTHAVVKNSDGFYVIGDVASPAESSHL